jgi:hypothetical protein
VSTWDRKALNFINQTSRWDKDKHISSFLAFSISLVKNLVEADIALQLEFEDEETAKVKCASPVHLNEIVMNPEPIKNYYIHRALKLSIGGIFLLRKKMYSRKYCRRYRLLLLFR